MHRLDYITIVDTHYFAASPILDRRAYQALVAYTNITKLGTIDDIDQNTKNGRKQTMLIVSVRLGVSSTTLC